jgi:hypothetical protein
MSQFQLFTGQFLPVIQVDTKCCPNKEDIFKGSGFVGIDFNQLNQLDSHVLMVSEVGYNIIQDHRGIYREFLDKKNSSKIGK